MCSTQAHRLWPDVVSAHSRGPATNADSLPKVQPHRKPRPSGANKHVISYHTTVRLSSWCQCWSHEACAAISSSVDAAAAWRHSHHPTLLQTSKSTHDGECGARPLVLHTTICWDRCRLIASLAKAMHKYKICGRRFQKQHHRPAGNRDLVIHY